jgi:minor histocompatibility antigen H13
MVIRLQTPKSIRHRGKATKKEVILNPDDSDDEDDEEVEERIGLTDSLMFPVIASCMLLGLFLVFKYLDSKWINKILGGYCESDRVTPGQPVD